jgi:hypothetical protein
MTCNCRRQTAAVAPARVIRQDDVPRVGDKVVDRTNPSLVGVVFSVSGGLVQVSRQGWSGKDAFPIHDLKPKEIPNKLRIWVTTLPSH